MWDYTNIANCQETCSRYICNQVSSVPVNLVSHVRLLLLRRVLLGKSLGDVIPEMVDKLTSERQLRPGFRLKAHIHAYPGRLLGIQSIA